MDATATHADENPGQARAGSAADGGSTGDPRADHSAGCHLGRLTERTLDRLGDHRSMFFEGTWHTSGGIFERARRVSAGLRDLGVGPGDRVVLVMANCPEVGILYQAIWRAGAVTTPVVFLVSADELAHIVRNSEAVAVATTPEWLPKIEAALAGLDLPVIVVGDADPAPAAGALRLVPFAELEAAEPGSLVDRADDDLAALLYTGGTTGASKGVALTHQNLCHAGSSSRQLSDVLGVNRSLTALPLSHSYGLLVTVGELHALEPRTTVLMRWFEPARLLALMAEHRVQVTAMVPSMLAMLLAQPLEDFDLSDLCQVFSGAAPLPGAVAAEFERRVPSARVLEGYGCTESGGIISTSPPDRPRPGTVGIAVPNLRVRVVDDRDAPVPIGVDGEIVVRGPMVMAGYWREPEQTEQVMAGGWLHTGDIGHLDADGYLTVVDRKKDLIIRGGYNVFPRDVEDVLTSHPAVAAAAVVGQPDPRLGEEVVGYVALAPGASVEPEALIAYAKEHLAKTKYPRYVHILDEVPLTSVGKVDRKRLRAGPTPG